MRKLLKEKYIVILLFITTLIVFFFAQQDTRKFDEQYLNSDLDTLPVVKDTLVSP